jgi:hypothetical protein
LPGATGIATIHTLLEYNAIELVISVEHQLILQADELSKVQVATISTAIVDSITGLPLLVYPFSDDVQKTIEISSPFAYSNLNYEFLSPTTINFQPYAEYDFGEHQVTVNFTAGNFTFGPFTETIYIPDLRPPPIEPEPSNLPIIIAIIIGGILILAALIIAFRARKREAGYRGAIEMKANYSFHGKLSVYAVILEGGSREVSPFDFSLHEISEKRISLRSILYSAGIRDVYGAEDILFLIGPEESVIIRNNSNSTIKIMGRDYGRRSKAQLFYDQKCYVILEKDENELEIHYRRTKNAK